MNVISNPQQILTGKDAALSLLGDAIFDLIILMMIAVIVASLVSLKYVLPITISANITYVAVKFLVVQKHGYHPALSMINKQLVTGGAGNTTSYLWPSLVSVPAIGLLSLLTASAAPSAAMNQDDLYYVVERVLIEGRFDDFILFRTGISALAWVEYSKIRFTVIEN